MFDVRKILIIFLVGVLYAIFSYSLIDAIYPNPKYEDFCRDSFVSAPIYPPTVKQPDCPALKELQCDQKAMPKYTYSNKTGCPISMKCDYCQRDYDSEREKHNLVVFIFASILGLIALGIGLLMPLKKDISGWVATGFLLGGLITIFIGTAIYYGDMARIARPIVLFVELALVIFLAYRQFKKK